MNMSVFSYNGSQEYYYKRDGQVLIIGIYQDSSTVNDEYGFYFRFWP